jgi:hypothetical protein
MSKSTLVEDASQQPQQKRQLRARRGRNAAAGTSRSGSPSNIPDAAACLQLDTNTPLEAASLAALDSKQFVTKQQQQDEVVLDASHQPETEQTGRAAKRQRQQQQHDGQTAAAAAAPQQRMSAFEAERAARIAANMARLAALELPQIAAGLAAMQPSGKVKAAAGPSQRGVGSSKRKRSDEQQPVRRSARNKGEAPDPSTAGGIDYETRDGSVVLLHGAVGRWGGSSGEAAAAVVAAPPGPLPFRSSNGDEASDAAFLALLAAQAAAVSEQQRPSSSAADGQASRRSNYRGSSSSSGATGQMLSGLSLAAADVAKMTRDGISCLAFHPSSSRLLIAAADKQGKVRAGLQQQRGEKAAAL